MAGNKYIELSSGRLAEKAAIQTSAGAGDAGKIPALDAAGKLDSTMMPSGVAADTAAIAASENLAAGDMVNVYDDSGTAKCRKADASDASKPAHGFVLAAVTSPNNATVYFEGQNTQVSGLTPGARQYLSGATAGAITETPPSTATHIVQCVGVAISATVLNFEAQEPVTLA